ncbi:MAG: Unknown protein [uncultured Sulfurovum sp.]|uniref:Ribbon-helix-helix protein CopG domain-containing protein n=1 Tax=uncultured Sulfurovum sp. TaxID=269237 RepID=A0A6S6TVP4_9BACT|nr:MAG: Unknown protein [uncultured Sulfurovum sp.]
MLVSVNYKKELYSLPIEIVNQLVTYAQETKQKKSHVVAEAINAYIKEQQKKKLAQEAKTLIGMIHANTPNIQDIKAHKYD